VLQVLRLPEALQKRVAAGKLKVAHARVLAPLADRPDLLKEIERQMDEAPGLWETKVGFHRGVELVKQQDAKRGTNPKPPRAPQSRLAADGGNVADQVAPALLDPPATAAAVEERADQELSQAAYDAGRKACVAGEPRELASPASDEELADWQRGWDDADRSSPDAAGSDGRPIDGRHGHMTPAGFKRFHSAAMEVRQAQSEARADLVDQIVALIGQITTWRQLDAVKVALKARSAELLQGAS
jgi:hypothetical protein